MLIYCVKCVKFVLINLGSSRFSGEGRFDFKKEVVRVSVAISHPFDKLDLVIDAFQRASIQMI
jgi:hypothetical protein